MVLRLSIEVYYAQVGNEAPRKKIVLNKVTPQDWTGSVKLTSPDGRLLAFTAAEGGMEVELDDLGTVYANANLPVELWVQGDAASDQMRDAVVNLAPYGPPGGQDPVHFTVLWVTVSSTHTGPISLDNAGRIPFSTLVVPPEPPDCFELGQHLLATWSFLFEPENATNSLASEFCGSVAPSNFVVSDFSAEPSALHLTREIVNAMEYHGPTGSENPEAVPGGQETSPECLRDDDPQSGDSEGTIYDLDGPGIIVWVCPVGTINRYRVNFSEWAEFDGTRCSARLPWYTRQSYKKTGISVIRQVDSATANTLSVNGGSWPEDYWAPGVVRIIAGTGEGQVRRVTANTSNTLTVFDDWGVLPDETSYFEVINLNTWTVWDDIPGDNQSAEGQTDTSADLE